MGCFEHTDPVTFPVDDVAVAPLTDIGCVDHGPALPDGSSAGRESPPWSSAYSRRSAWRSALCIGRESGAPSHAATTAAATSGSLVLHSRAMVISRFLAGPRRQGARTITMPQA